MKVLYSVQFPENQQVKAGLSQSQNGHFFALCIIMNVQKMDCKKRWRLIKSDTRHHWGDRSEIEDQRTAISMLVSGLDIYFFAIKTKLLSFISKIISAVPS